MIIVNRQLPLIIEPTLLGTNVSTQLIESHRILEIPTIQSVNKSNIAREIKNGANYAFVSVASLLFCRINYSW